jgi:phospholipid/cholesterol/gamma-HCH transport system permease protein
VYVEAQREGDALALSLRGAWRIDALNELRSELESIALGGVRRMTIDSSAANFDLSSAWLLHDFLKRLTHHGPAHQGPAHQHQAQQPASIDFVGGLPPSLALIDHTLATDAAVAMPGQTPGFDPWLGASAAVEHIGRRVVIAARRSLSALDFLGHAASAAANAAVRWKRLHPTSIARHIYDTGVTAIPIVALIAFLIAVIMAYIGAQQLQKFGADIFVVDLVAIGVLRELAVLLTAIIVAGRSGSAFAAELGAMKLNEEVDALQATGVNPYEVLVVPRMIGLVVALPLLTVLADVVGLVGGGLLCRFLLDMPLVQYINRVQESISDTTFWVGIWKAPVFAILISLAGTRCGLRVRGSSRHLGAMTTLAVVQSIFFVILADALFAVLFMKLEL